MRELIIFILSLTFGGLIFCTALYRDYGVAFFKGKVLVRRETLKNYGWYKRLERFLKRTGAGYRFGFDVSPVGFVLMSIIPAFLGFLAVFFKSSNTESGVVLAGIIGISMVFVPTFILEIGNRSDNDKMLPDIKMIYTALQVQILSGVNITDALAESYANTKNQRLRDACLRLSGDICLKADINEALYRFRASFDNRFIDSLSAVVIQAMESGKAVESMNDISGEIRNMENIRAIHKKESLDRKVTLYQLIILGVMLLLIIYVCLTHMFSGDINGLFNF